MKTLTVDLGERSYPIYIGRQLFTSELIAKHIKSKQVLIVTNETIAPLYLAKTQAILSGFDHQTVVLPDGEQYKNLETLNNIYTALLTYKMDRSVTLIALGGGVIGDMTGFAAASYQRGVNFIQIPTTLLSQVDSSVGGKTGVNHTLGKNMIGAFHQPQCVLADTETLTTLDDQQLAAGIAEVIKYGLLGDKPFFEWLEANIELLTQRDPVALAYAIEQSCRDKAAIVAADEKESGKRALLNLGHTFGHAIETATGYGQWLHGEAIAVGMLMAADISQRLEYINEQDMKRIVSILERTNLPTKPPKEMTVTQFIDLMLRDKKALNGVIRLVLLRSIGDAFISDNYERSVLEQTLEAFLTSKE